MGRSGRRQVGISTHSGEHVVVDVRQHREDVIRRLLDRGVTERTLRALLPDFSPLIERLAAVDDAEQDRDSHLPAGS